MCSSGPPGRRSRWCGEKAYAAANRLKPVPSTAKDSAQFHKAEIDTEGRAGAAVSSPASASRGKTYDLEPAGLEQAVESHAGKHHDHKRGPPVSPSRAVRDRPRGAQVQFALLGRGTGETLVTVHAPCVVAAAIARHASGFFTLTSVGANLPSRPKNTENASPRRSQVSLPKKAMP